jgi:hypothetical protein
VEFLDESQLKAALERLAAIDSLFLADRVCLATTDLWSRQFEGHSALTIHRPLRRLSWLLRPLRPLLPSPQVVEVTAPSGIPKIGLESEDCRFHFFSKGLLDVVLAGVASSLVGGQIADLAAQDPSYGELTIHSDFHTEYWILLGKHNRDCAPDLASFLRKPA